MHTFSEYPAEKRSCYYRFNCIIYVVGSLRCVDWFVYIWQQSKLVQCEMPNITSTSQHIFVSCNIRSHSKGAVSEAKCTLLKWCISLAMCNTAVTSVLWQRIYCTLELSLWFVVDTNKIMQAMVDMAAEKNIFNCLIRSDSRSPLWLFRTWKTCGLLSAKCLSNSISESIEWCQPQKCSLKSEISQ